MGSTAFDVGVLSPYILRVCTCTRIGMTVICLGGVHEWGGDEHELDATRDTQSVTCPVGSFDGSPVNFFFFSL